MVEELITTSAGGNGGADSKKKPKYWLGKITNKYLIIDLYTLAYESREEVLYRMFMHDKSTRDLLINQYKCSTL